MRKTTTLRLLVAIAISSMLVTGCNEKKKKTIKKESLPAVKVTAAKVSEQTAPLQIEIMGTVQAVHSAVIATKVSGNVTEISVKLGDKVAKGDSLMKIDAGELQARLAQSKAQLTQAQRNLAREQKLLKKKAATPEAVKVQKDLVSIAQAGYQEAETMIQYTHVKAPFDALITRKLVNEGDLVTPGRPLLQLDNEKELQVIANLPETLLNIVSIGQELAINVPAINTTVTGKITELAPTADPVSRTALMKISLPATERLRPGQFARVNIQREQQIAAMVPKTAIFPMGQLERVFVVNDGKARLRLVRTGIISKEYVEILSGLSVDEQVVTHTSMPLKDGQPIIIDK